MSFDDYYSKSCSSVIDILHPKQLSLHCVVVEVEEGRAMINYPPENLLLIWVYQTINF